MTNDTRPGRIAATVATLVSVAFLTACSNPLRREASIETSLSPTRTPAPQQPTARPEPTSASETQDEVPAETKAQATATAPAARPVATKYELCSAAKPGLAAQTPALPDAAGQIVYLTTDNNIVLTDISGRSRVDITSDAYVSSDGQAGRIYQFPTFSADGKSLAFIGLSTTADFNGITNTVHVAPASSGAVSAMTDLYATADWNIPYLDWSPDGNQVAFLTINQSEGAIRVMDKAGGDVEIFDTGAPTYWHWRNDSSAMVTHLGGRATEKGAASISVIQANGPLKVSQSVLDQLPGGFQSPQYSPDGKHMLYVANTGAMDEMDELILADAAGKPLCTLTPVDDNAFFAWSSNGSHVAAMDTFAPVANPAPLVIFDLSDGSSKTIHDAASTFFWSPDGSQIAVFSIVQNMPLTPLGVGSGRLGAPAAQQRSVALRIEVVTPVSGKVVKVADTYPSRQLLQYLQFFDQYSRAVTPWSPDGKHIVFSSISQERGTADVAVGTVNGARATADIHRIAAGTLAFWSPR